MPQRWLLNRVMRGALRPGRVSRKNWSNGSPPRTRSAARSKWSLRGAGAAGTRPTPPALATAQAPFSSARRNEFAAGFPLLQFFETHGQAVMRRRITRFSSHRCGIATGRLFKLQPVELRPPVAIRPPPDPGFGVPGEGRSNFSMGSSSTHRHVSELLLISEHRFRKRNLYGRHLRPLIPLVQEADSARLQPAVLPIFHHLVLHVDSKPRPLGVQPDFQSRARLMGQHPLEMRAFYSADHSEVGNG